jgi:hypothetical protein
MLHSFKAIRPTRASYNIAGGDCAGIHPVAGHPFIAGTWDIKKLVELSKEGKLCYMQLPYFRNHPWKALEKAGCENVAELKENFAYQCVLLEETRHAFVPTGIQTTAEGLEKYRGNFEKDFFPGLGMDYLCSIDDLESADIWRAEDTLNRFQRLVLGSGYTFACLPSDGDATLEPVDIQLDNGDRLLGLVFNFYGK